MSTQGYADAIVATIREPLLVLDADLRVRSANPAFHRVFGTSGPQTEGRLVYELGNGSWQLPRLRELLEEILPSDGQFEELGLDATFPVVGRKILRLNARRLKLEGVDDAPLILLAIEDLTARRLAEWELSRQALIRQVTLSSIGDAVITTDVDSLVTFMNPTAERLCGWAQEEAGGVSLSEVFKIVNEETRGTVESPVTKALREGAIVGLANHTILIAKDGAERFIDDSAAPIRDANGQIGGVVLVFRDIGDRRRAEMQIEISETRFRRLFEASRDGIMILDAASGQILDVNRSLVELLSYSRNFFLGKPLQDLAVFRDADVGRSLLESLHAAEFVRRDEVILRDADGRHVSVEMVSSVYREDGHSVIQCNIRDTRERKRSALEREALLADEHAARVEAQAAERSNRAKDEFLATLSHEMRTPLNAILGWTAILGANPEVEVVKQGIEVIARNARAQAKLIEDVLDVSRIISDKMSLDTRPCDLRDVLMSAIETVRPQAESKGVAFDAEPFPDLLGVSCCSRFVIPRHSVSGL